MIKFVDWKSGNVSSIVIVTVIGFGLVLWQGYSQEQARLKRIKEWQEIRATRNAVPIENWLDQRTISVPDFVLGDDVNIVIDRDKIKQPFTANWSVSVIEADENLADICDVSGFKVYNIGESLPITGVSLKSMFAPRPCDWHPGRFVLRATWIIHRPGYEDATIVRTSNPFNVLEKGSQLFVEPEQAKKLEGIK